MLALSTALVLMSKPLTSFLLFTNDQYYRTVVAMFALNLPSTPDTALGL